MYPISRYVPRAVLAACFVSAACGRAPGDENLALRGGVTAGGLRGTALDQPLQKPSFVLTRADGGSFDFTRETDGKVTLLFFGYTHCPDVCPLHLANIAAVLKKMPWSAREMVRVVFVTTDPERDTPQRLSEWLGEFDPSFVGLYGEQDEVDRAQQSLGVAPAVRQETPGTSNEYLVGHAAQVFAFGRDNVARVVYPFGTRQEDWAHDLPRLAGAAGSTEPQAAAAAPQIHSLGPRAQLAIGPAVIAVGADGRTAAMYLTIANGMKGPDTLHNVSIIGGAPASLHVTTTSGGSATMQLLPWIEIPGGETLQMRPGGTHVMLESGAGEALRAGSSAVVELHFARGGRVTALGSVVGYAQLDSVLALVRQSLAR